MFFCKNLHPSTRLFKTLLYFLRFCFRSGIFDLLYKTYKGYLYDRVEKPDDCKYQYMIYIKEINLSCTFTINKFIENYTEHDFKLYIFHHENTFKRKVKIQIIYQE